MTLRPFLILSILLSASLPAAAQLPEDFPDLPGRFTDPRDGETYSTVEMAGREWLAENLRYRPEGSSETWCYGDRLEACERHGALYAWSAALEACPPGWRLPRASDWRRLTVSLGGPELAVRALAPGGTAGFDLAPAGARDDEAFAGLGDAGFWWSRDRAEAADQARGLYLDHGGSEEPRLEPAARSTEGFGASVRCLR